MPKLLVYNKELQIVQPSLKTRFGDYENRYGRRISILLGALLFTLGALIMIISDMRQELLIGR